MPNLWASRRVPFIVLLLALTLLLPGSLWGKLHDDEVLYWEIARNIATGLGPVSTVDPNYPRVFIWHVPVVSYLAAPLTVLSGDILPVRLLAAGASAIGALMVFRIAERLWGRQSAWMTFLLLMASLHWLRFGGRFYYDPFGFAFFWTALDAHLKGRPVLAGVVLGLAVLAREFWLLPALVLFIPAVVTETRWRFLAGLAVPILVAAWWIFGVVGLQDFVRESAVLGGGAALANKVRSSPWEHVQSAIRAFIEAVAAHGAGSLGVLTAAILAWKRVPTYVWMLFLSALSVLFLVPGFLANGGFTQYPLILSGFVSLIGGAGLGAMRERLVTPRNLNISPVIMLLIVVLIQVVVGNSLINRGTLYGSSGIYGLGIEPDRQVISLLRAEAAGQSIAGIHGAFVPGSRWHWVERHVERFAVIKPDWIVTYAQWVAIDPASSLDVQQVGPYVVIRVPQPEELTWALRPGRILLPSIPGGQ